MATTLERHSLLL